MDYNEFNDNEQYFSDYFTGDYDSRRNSLGKSGRRKTTDYNIDKYGRRRKGLKWKLKAFLHSGTALIALAAVVVLIVIIVMVSSCSGNKEENQIASTAVATVAPTTEVTSYKIDGVPVVVQDNLKAACETYACTMLLQYYKFDIDEVEFVDNYLVTRPVYYGIDGNLYGPDMNCAYAGDVYTGYGINAPGMAKCMNNYIKTTDSKLTAQPLVGVSLEELCEKYVRNDIPVMVWATTYMYEPYVKATWIVDYVDENADHEIGDTVSWQMHEHCLVLIGFDDKNYYFCDSVSGEVSAYDRETTEVRYEQIGKQAIVLQ